jgi:signal transduction histidine kinase/ligand-binding sensor domain-containing protein
MFVLRWLLFIFWALIGPVFAQGTVDLSDLPITFERRSWSPNEGAPTGAWQIAQDRDGILWLPSAGGLYRYDGERFYRVSTIYGHKLRSNNVTTVVPLKEGIAVLYQFGGMSIFFPREVTHYASADGLPAGKISDLAQMPNGDLFAGTVDGVVVLQGKKWRPLQLSGLHPGIVTKILVDHEKTVWVVLDKVLYGRKAGSTRFKQVMQLSDWLIPDIAMGKLLVIGPDNTAIQVEYDKKPFVLMDGLNTGVDMLFEGPRSTLWAWMGSKGKIARLSKQESGKYKVVKWFDEGRLGRATLLSWLLDREGNVWLSTTSGVERLRAQRIHEVPIPDAVFSPYVHQGLGDAIFIGGLAAPKMLILDSTGGKASLDLPNVQAMWRENEDSLWAGSPSALFHVRRSGVTKWPLPKGLTSNPAIQAITVDQSGQVWVSIARAGLYKFTSGQWGRVNTDNMGDYAIPVTMHASKEGGVWLGFTNSRLGKLVNGSVRAVTAGSSIDVGNVLALVERNGKLIVGGENGLGWFDGRGMQRIMPQQIDTLRGISGLGLDLQGNLWGHGLEGVFRISKSELDKFEGDVQYPVKLEWFSVADGIRGNPAQIRPLPTLSVADDGRIFYATNSQIGWINPRTIFKNEVAPSVLVQWLTVYGEQFQPEPGLSLKEGTTALEIKYAVTALSVPEKVQIKYRLSGVDHDWQVPTGERVARYTNLEPGSYTFHVIASNEDGVWNEQGATFQFEILPRFWQTMWFRIFLLLAIIAAIAAFQRWRITTALARAAERSAARMEERERIARNLHDTLLQGIHALILRGGTVLNRLQRGSEEQRVLESVLDQAEGLVEETRVSVMALRSKESAEKIFDEIYREIQLVHSDIDDRLKLDLSGDVKIVPPELAYEVCQVFKEGITNAARHSGATAIHASLNVHAGGITGAVIDNGTGIPAEIVSAGKAGHWGILIMRERMSSIGGKIVITANANTGTAIRFNVNWHASHIVS